MPNDSWMKFKWLAHFFRDQRAEVFNIQSNVGCVTALTKKKCNCEPISSSEFWLPIGIEHRKIKRISFKRKLGCFKEFRHFEKSPENKKQWFTHRPTPYCRNDYVLKTTSKIIIKLFIFMFRTIHFMLNARSSQYAHCTSYHSTQVQHTNTRIKPNIVRNFDSMQYEKITLSSFFKW